MELVVYAGKRRLKVCKGNATAEHGPQVTMAESLQGAWHSPAQGLHQKGATCDAGSGIHSHLTGVASIIKCGGSSRHGQVRNTAARRRCMCWTQKLIGTSCQKHVNA